MSAKRRRETYRRNLEEQAIREHCRGKEFPTVLDFGCGTGWFASWFSQRGSRVLGVEVQPDSLTAARRACARDGVLLVRYGGGCLPARGEWADLVLAVGVVRSLLERGPLGEALQEWLRCLKPGGHLLLIETDNAAFRRHMRPEELKRAIVQAGLEAISWYPIRKVTWWGLGLVKMGFIPRSLYASLARWELWIRRQSPFLFGKYAYLGEFRKGVMG